MRFWSTTRDMFQMQAKLTVVEKRENSMDVRKALILSNSQ